MRSQLTPSPTAENSPLPPFTPAYTIALVALEGTHQETETIGCGDAIVPVFRESNSSSVEIALTELLATAERTVRDDNVELYNALAQSDLTVKNVTINDGVATINLTGQLRLGGVCDSPRVEEQLVATAKQFPEIKEVKIFINGSPLSDMLSQQ